MKVNNDKQKPPLGVWGLVLMLIFIFSFFFTCKSPVPTQSQTVDVVKEIKKDSVAERMLVAQRNNGGWSQPNGDPFDYTKELSSTQKALFLSEKAKLDATIDDDATTKEIRYLVKAFKETNNPDYKKAAENGIKYLLSAQNDAGGWGQFYPDWSGYRGHITYNDNAMMNVMWIMKYATESTNDFEIIDKTLIPQTQNAVQKGLQCILKTQYSLNGKLTAWCAQHDRITLQPAKARAFELASISGSESVGIVKFLMAINNPSAEIKNSIKAACEWLESVKIAGINIKTIEDPSQTSGKDRVIYDDPNSTLWARFYDLKTNKPFFTGRDSVPKENLKDIENERRVGYAYYGTWAKTLLASDYPAWLKKN
jgi:PelA/Pel-15E family pectate lyase